MYIDIYMMFMKIWAKIKKKTSHIKSLTNRYYSDYIPVF